MPVLGSARPPRPPGTWENLSGPLSPKTATCARGKADAKSSMLSAEPVTMRRPEPASARVRSGRFLAAAGQSLSQRKRHRGTLVRLVMLVPVIEPWRRAGEELFERCLEISHAVVASQPRDRAERACEITDELSGRADDFLALLS